MRYLFIADYPQMMSETVIGYEIIFGFTCGITFHDIIDLIIVGIGEEYRLHICILYANMDHTVFLLILACKLVFLDLAGKVILYIGADHQAICVRPSMVWA